MHRDPQALAAWKASFVDPPRAEVEAEAATRHVRSVWISDVHLGTPGCKAGALLAFLKQVQCDNLFLVGDIVDGWQLRRSRYWPQAHNAVVQELLRKARTGTRVVFIPGNHDEFARRYVSREFGGIVVANEWLHETADGRKLWITHGDLFDGVIQCAKWLAYRGDSLYGFILGLNRHLGTLRARADLPWGSLSRFLKSKGKRAVGYITELENAVAREAKRRRADGVVCGHIHPAEMRTIEGVLYANDGDWVESLTAIVEHPCGRLEIVTWPEWSLGGEHTRFPEFVAAATGLPACIGYAWMRRFHRPSSGVLVPSLGTLRILEGHGFANLRRGSHGIDLERLRPTQPAELRRPRPVFLYEPVGRHGLAVAVLASPLSACEFRVARDVGRLRERDVVARDQHAVFRDEDVGLDHVGAGGEGERIGLERFSRVVGRGTAVRDHQRLLSVERGVALGGGASVVVVVAAARGGERGKPDGGGASSQA